MKSLQVIAIFIIILSVGFLVQSNGLLLKHTPKEAMHQTSKLESTISKNAVSETHETIDSPTRTDVAESAGLYYYPNASVISDTGSTMTLRSSDNPDDITEWYEARIKGSGMNTKTFVKTKANGVITNTLTGASATEEVTIHIKKERESDTTINVKIKSY